MNNHHWKGEVPDPNNYFGFVYLIECLVSGKKYIGKKQYWASKSGVVGCKSKVTDKSSPKWKNVCWKEGDWRFYTGSSKEFNSYIEKIGKDNFVFTILSQHNTKGGLHYAEIREQVLRDVLRAKDIDNGYIYFNKQIAAIKFRPPDEYPEQAKIKWKIWWDGLSEEERCRLNSMKAVKGPANPNYGVAKSEEIKKKLSEKAKGRPSGFKGKTHTTEAKKIIGEKSAKKEYSEGYRRKLSKSQSGENNGNFSSTVISFIHETGEEFTGTRYAFLTAFSLDPSSLTKLLSGKRKSLAGWRVKGR